jgi:ABC-type glycerol-3-phosphate transport system substrate-binding protein
MPADDWFQDEVALTVAGQIDPDFFNNVRYDEGNWDTPENRQALEDYAALYEDGTFDKATLDMDYGAAMTTSTKASQLWSSTAGGKPVGSSPVVSSASLAFSSSVSEAQQSSFRSSTSRVNSDCSTTTSVSHSRKPRSPSRSASY